LESRFVATLGFGAVGFADDYLNLVKHRSLGLTGRQKLVVSVHHRVRGVGGVFIATRYLQTKYSWNSQHSVLQRNGSAKRHQHDSVSICNLVLIIIVLLGWTNAVKSGRTGWTVWRSA
jgi:phospho-N-acetylmuramoyl-pentapeptide-transferase